MHYNFKSIQIVPSGKDFLDIVLSKTQRKTPTVIHKGYAISRIRRFYMRKVKFTQDTFDEKIGQILQDFPKIEDIHPFYADLMNVLYDRDHYKLALGQLSTGRSLIEKVGKEYLKLLKFGDSLYRCKQLKRAALGRMATIMKRQKESLEYLEQVRQHLSRLPSIDPNTRTLLVCGFPNVGKSSFMNTVTRADVDVQPYAFTTKSLFVGHFDYQYLRWQVIDTPGILDHPLEERNTIEMQSITALAHIRACILYFFDCSEQCGYTLDQQVRLFQSIKPLFNGKPIVLVSNKCDVVKLSDLPYESKVLLASISNLQVSSSNIDHVLKETFLETSTLAEQGVMRVRNIACEKLLSLRVEQKLKSSKMTDILNRIHVAMPKARDQKERLPFIPEAVLSRNSESPRLLERDIERDNGGAGVYSMDLKKHYLINNDYKYDAIPEIMNGKNISDFVDPEIEEKLLSLEQEEEEKMTRGDYDVPEIGPKDLEIERLNRQVQEKRKLATLKSQLAGNNSHIIIPMRDRKRKEIQRIRKNENVKMKVEENVLEEKMNGLKDKKSKLKAERIRNIAQVRHNKLGRAGEADRHIRESKPKHLYSGKRSVGKTDRR